MPVIEIELWGGGGGVFWWLVNMDAGVHLETV